MALSVIIPVYNEESTIEALVARVQAVPIDKEIIVIDDASTDGTSDKLRTRAISCGRWRTVMARAITRRSSP